MKKFKRIDGCTGNANEECQFFFSFGVGQFGNEQVKSCSYLDGKASDSWTNRVPTSIIQSIPVYPT